MDTSVPYASAENFPRPLQTSSRGGVVRLSVLSLLYVFCLISLLFCAVAAWTQTSDVPTGQDDQFSRIGLLRRFPDQLADLHVQPPKKHPARYDMSCIGNRGVGKGINFYSIEKEIAFGRELSNEIDRTVRLVNDPVILEYVDRLVQRIALNSDANVPFAIKVIHDNQPNAFSMPGGFLYLNSGMILAVGNEAELAGVMAHEIAHVSARHGTRQLTKSNLFSLATFPLSFVSGPAAMLARQGLNVTLPIAGLKFGRDAEKEADLLGLQYIYLAGYDPQEFIRFLEKSRLSGKSEHGIMNRLFGTHPPTGERIKRAQEEIREYIPSRESYIVDSSDFQKVRQQVLELSNVRLKHSERQNIHLVVRRAHSTTCEQVEWRDSEQRWSCQ